MLSNKKQNEMNSRVNTSTYLSIRQTPPCMYDMV